VFHPSYFVDIRDPDVTKTRDQSSCTLDIGVRHTNGYVTTPSDPGSRVSQMFIIWRLRPSLIMVRLYSLQRG